MMESTTRTSSRIDAKDSRFSSTSTQLPNKERIVVLSTLPSVRLVYYVLMNIAELLAIHWLRTRNVCTCSCKSQSLTNRMFPEKFAPHNHQFTLFIFLFSFGYAINFIIISVNFYIVLTSIILFHFIRYLQNVVTNDVSQPRSAT